jgi:hypothetical protein
VGPKSFVPFYITRPRDTNPLNPVYTLPSERSPPPPPPPPPLAVRSSLDVRDITSSGAGTRPASAAPSHPRAAFSWGMDASEVAARGTSSRSRPASARAAAAARDDVAGASPRNHRSSAQAFDLSTIWAHPDFKHAEGSKAKPRTHERRDHLDGSLRTGERTQREAL